MFKPVAVLMGVAMLGLGAGQLDAQVSVRVNKDHSGKSVEVKVGDSGRGRDNSRDEGRRDNGRPAGQRDRGIGQERVWVVDYVMVEERYFEPGYWKTVEKQVWVPDQHVKTIERVWVPEKHVMVEETVYVAGQHVTRKVARRDRHGCVYYVQECVWVPAHYEKKMVEKCIPGHYEDREVCKVIPGHYKTVCEKVYVEGCYKTRMVKRECGGHWEVKKPDPCQPCKN